MKIFEDEHLMPQTGKKEPTIQFNYYLKDELINVKYRTYDKKFVLETGAELIPYNLNGITGEQECIITEGEMDCLSFIEVGKSNCISVPNGANSNLAYLDDFIEGWFDDKSTIFIATDTDQKGIMLRDELVRRFGSERCRIVTYGDGCKDANEHLIKYGKESLLRCLADAKEVKVEGVFAVTDFEDSLDAYFAEGLPKGVTIGHPNFDVLCSFETKRLAVVTGIPGSGKSEFLDEIAERLNLRYGWRFAFFSPENAPLAYHAGKLIEKFVGKKFESTTMTQEEYAQAKQRINENMFFISPKDDFSIDTILSKAKYLIRRYGIKALVIDPFNRLTLETSGFYKETDMIRDLLSRLSNFAQQNDVLVFLMAHPTKQQRNKDGVVEAPSLYDIAGSAHFFNMADYGIVVHRDRPNNLVEIKVEKVRFKHLGGVGTATMRYNMVNGRYAPYTSGSPILDNSNHLVTPDLTPNQSLRQRLMTCLVLVYH
ncbi:MAG: toprim domain-containing protein [Muribaculaceae bacterium]|nr:toprim domain-containing protein [Muribaculaceae bacterium]